MWDEAKRRHLNELRQRELTGTLADEERALLDRLRHELEQDEWERLGPELRRLHTEQAELRKSCGQRKYLPLGGLALARSLVSNAVSKA